MRTFRLSMAALVAFADGATAFRLSIAALVVVFAGCATAPPVQQVRAFANAADAFNTASQPLLDEAAVAERDRALRQIKEPPEGTKNVLEVPGTTRRVLLDLPIDKALAIQTIGDPPATAIFRKAVGAIKHYSAVLVLLAEGQNIAAARAELGLFANSLAGVAALIPGAEAAPALVGPALGALQPLIDDAARAQNAAELRRLVLEAAPKIKTVNEKLRAAANPLFHTLASGPRAVMVAGGDAVTAADRIEAYRISVANWLMLLELIDQANDQLVAAVVNPANPSTLASLNELSTRITTYAEATRRALAIVRSGKQP